MNKQPPARFDYLTGKSLIFVNSECQDQKRILTEKSRLQRGHVTV